MQYNRHLFSNLRYFMQYKNISDNQEILIPEYKLIIIHFFNKDLMLFLYYSGDGKINGMQFIRTHMMGLYNIIGLIITDNGIQFHSENFAKEEFFITGEIAPKNIIEPQWSVMRHNFHITSNYFLQYFHDYYFSYFNLPIRIPFETIIMFLNCFRRILIRKLDYSMTDASIEFSAEADEPLLFVPTHQDVDNYTGNQLPLVIIGLIGEYFPHHSNGNITYLVNRLTWKVKKIDEYVGKCDALSSFNVFSVGRLSDFFYSPSNFT